MKGADPDEPARHHDLQASPASRHARSNRRSPTRARRDARLRISMHPRSSRLHAALAEVSRACRDHQLPCLPAIVGARHATAERRLLQGRASARANRRAARAGVGARARSRVAACNGFREARYEPQRAYGAGVPQPLQNCRPRQLRPAAGAELPSRGHLRRGLAAAGAELRAGGDSRVTARHTPPTIGACGSKPSIDRPAHLCSAA